MIKAGLALVNRIVQGAPLTESQRKRIRDSSLPRKMLHLLTDPDSFCHDQDCIDLILYSLSNLTAEDPIFRNEFLDLDVLQLLAELFETELTDDTSRIALWFTGNLMHTRAKEKLTRCRDQIARLALQLP